MTEVKKRKRKKATSDSNSKRISSDFKGVIYITIGLILAIAVYSDLGGILSRFSKILIYRIIGMGMFLVPLAMIYIGFSIIYNDGKVMLTRRIVGVTVSIIIFVIFLSTAKIQTLNTDSFYNSLEVILTEEALSLHGGFIGHVIGYPLSVFLGFIGAYILYFSILSLTLMMAFDIKVKEVVYFIQMIFEKMFSIREKPKKKKYKNIASETSERIIVENERVDGELDFNEPEHKMKILNFMKNSELIDDDVNQDLEDEIVGLDIEEVVEEVDYNKQDPVNLIGRMNSLEEVKERTDNSSRVVSKDIESGFNDRYYRKEKKYVHPKTNLLKENGKSKLRKEDKNELLKSANKLVETLNSFGVEAKVTKVSKGPSVTRFELQPSPGVKVSKIVNLQDDIALGLAAGGIRMEAPIPGKAAIGIEVPNKTQTPVFLKEVLDSKEFNSSDKKLAFALGKDIGGECMIGDLAKMPHMLIAGATGSGKSVCVNSLIVSLIYKYSPNDVKLLMVDPKVVELSVYNDIPHLLIPVVTDPKKAAGALNWAVNEMNRRYNLFSSLKVKNIESYNNLLDKGTIEEKLPYIVIIVDELADLMMACPGDVEDYICRLAQMARAAGMHLIIATQRPSVDVITGVIKANIPSRISFAVSSGIDSRTIIDQYGAEKLLGRGDMLYYPMGSNKPQRVQGAFISEEEVENVVEFVKKDHEPTDYEESILEHINSGPVSSDKEDSDEDELLDEAINLVIEYNQASTSFLQRKLKVGFNRASRIMDALEARGVITPKDGSKPRQVLILKEDMNNNY